MDRRSTLRLAGAALAGIAGCSGLPGGSTDTRTGTPIPGPKQGDDLPPDEDSRDGYPPSFDTTPEAREVDPSSFETLERNGVDVPRAPVEDVYYWYARGEARFADARSRTAYDRTHIFGAVSSPEPDGGSDDPVDEWPVEDRIVCYCGCPHHLSSIRAASLIDDGYEEVYIIDEGLWDGWDDRGYPLAGSEVESAPASWVIEGLADDRHAGDTAWARHRPSGQREATAIGTEGRFELELRFADVSADSPIEVETPGFRVAGTLGELSAGVVTTPT